MNGVIHLKISDAMVAIKKHPYKVCVWVEMQPPAAVSLFSNDIVPVGGYVELSKAAAVAILASTRPLHGDRQPALVRLEGMGTKGILFVN